MKKLCYLFAAVFVVCTVFQGCGTEPDVDMGIGYPSPEAELSTVPEKKITAETAYEGICNYCRITYDWSAAEDNPDIMYLEMGEETESEYQVIFRSYTGAFVYFYVDKSSGTTRITEYVPILDLEEEVGAIELFDYLD